MDEENLINEENPWENLIFEFKSDMDAVCYSDCCGKELLTLSAYLENPYSVPLKKFKISVKFSEQILLNVPDILFSGNIGTAESNRNVFENEAPFQINPVVLRGLTEEFSVLATASVLDSEGNTLKKQDITIKAMPMDYWNGEYKTLSFFIERNSPEIIALQKEVSEAMNELTGTNSLNAYQSKDSGKVLAQCAAVYSALQKQKLFYIEPKQSDFLCGQRIRLVAEILREKGVTCLDSTLLFCALAESIGLHPIVCLIPGHAFPGVWLDGEKMSDSLVHDDPAEVVALSETINQKLCVVESTCFTQNTLVSFTSACEAARKNALDAPSLKIIDVLFARKLGVCPIPRQIISPEGEITLEDDPEFVHIQNKPDEIEYYELGEISAADNGPKTKLDTWERKLLSSSTRSPLLNEKIKSTSVLILHPQIEALEDALCNGKSFSLIANPIGSYEFSLEDDSAIKSNSAIISSLADAYKLCTGEDEKKLVQKLKNINRKAQVELSETGVNPLFLTLGHIEYEDSTGKKYCAPIILYPVSLTKKGRNSFELSIRDGEEAQINYSIFEKFSNEFNVRTSLDYANLPSDGYGLDIRRILQIVKHDVGQQRGWRVGESCLLGLFSFDQAVMWNDIHSHSDLLLENKIVSGLMDNNYSADQEENLPDVVEDDFVKETIPVSCDESQMRAVKAAANGSSFILQGPPGTGKSQTITAMIVNALSKGKKVLFVAEKMAALQVVFRNLSLVNCSEYLLEMHSTKVTKSHLIEQLDKALERKEAEVIDISNKEKAINDILSELSGYMSALHSKTSCGESLYELINRNEDFLTISRDQIPFQYLKNLSLNDVEECCIKMREFSRNIKKYLPLEDSPFNELHFSEFTESKQVEIREAIKEAVKAFDDINSELSEFIASCGLNTKPQISFSAVSKIADLGCSIDKIKEDRIPSEFICNPLPEVSDAISAIKQYQSVKNRYGSIVRNEWNLKIFEQNIPALLQEWDSVKNGIFNHNHF